MSTEPRPTAVHFGGRRWGIYESFEVAVAVARNQGGDVHAIDMKPLVGFDDPRPPVVITAIGPDDPEWDAARAAHMREG